MSAGAVDYRLVFRRTGGPEVIEREAYPAAPLVPGPGEARVRHTAIGLNFVDTYLRSGLNPVPRPSPLGSEGAGIVEALGEGVEGLSVGDRVAYGSGPLGGYATARLIPAEHLVRLPAGVSDETAAAAMLKGMTACYIVEQCAKVQSGQTVLVHAAAGGVGSILVPWIRAIGGIVIAHAGSSDKAARALSTGAAHALSCPMTDLAEQVRGLTGGKGADVVIDGIGRDSWQASLGSLARMGLLVSYGNASGPVDPFTPADLMAAGSIFVTRPTLAHYGATAQQRRHLAARVFAMIDAGLEFPIGQRFPLAEAVAAHRSLEARQTVGATILVP